MTITFLYRQPKVFFYKKPFKQKVYNNDKILRIKASSVQYRYYGLKAVNAGRLKFKQIEAVRKMFLFFFREESDLLIRLHFSSPVTTKSAGVRMGRGKGKLSHWVANVKRGQIIFELSKKIKMYKLPVILKLIRERIPIKLKFVRAQIW